MIRSGLLLAAGFVGSLVASFWISVPASDPLRGSLVAVPLVIAALMVIGIWAQRHGGSKTPSRVAILEWVLLGLLLLLAVGRYHLGLTPRGESSNLLLVAGLGLLLAHRVGRVVLALRPALGSVLPAQPPWPYFALPLVVYLSILPWSAASHPPDGDEPHYLLLTHSLAYDFDSDLANNYENADSLHYLDRRLEPQLGDPVGRQGELYSRHNMLLPLILAPAYRLFGTLGALVVMAIMTATVVWLTLALASHYTPNRPGEALAAYAVLAFSAPLLLYSYQIWVEVPAALLTLVVLIQIHQVGKPNVRPSLGWLGLALSLLLLPLLKLRFLLVAVSLVVLMSIRSDRAVRKRTLLLIAGLAVLGPAILLFNQSIFQNPLKYHDIDGLKPYVLPAVNYLQGLVGLAFDCAFGLFFFAPIWLLLLPAFALLVSSRSKLALDFAIVFAPYLALLAPRGEWFGAWSPPFRYGIVMLPMLALWLVPLFERRDRPGAKFLLAGLSAMTLVLTLLWYVEPGWTYNLAHGRSHLLDLLAVQMDLDLARFFPSSTRVRAATWIWPPIAFLLVSLLWWVRVPRRSAALVAGLAAAILVPSAVVLAARSKATRVIEFEDPWVEKHAGSLYPEIWVIYRPRFRGGWLLTNDQSLTVPLVADKDHFDLRIDYRNRWDLPVAGSLELSGEDGRVLGVQQLPGVNDWQQVEFTNLERPRGNRLTIKLVPPGPVETHAILDRAFLDWK